MPERTAGENAGKVTSRRRVGAWMAALALAAGAPVLAAPADAAAQRLAPYTCKQGYVWREATAGDLVCVTPAIRSQTAAENAAGPSNQQPGSVFCKQGFVWRETRPSDLVCVVPSSRTQAKSDNANAPYRLVDPGATPQGGVSVRTESHQLGGGGYLYATGTGLSANQSVRFYAVGIGTVGPYSLGSLTANAQGALSAGTTSPTCAAGHSRPGPRPSSSSTRAAAR